MFKSFAASAFEPAALDSLRPYSSLSPSDSELPNVVILNDTAFVNGGSAQVALSSAIALAQQGCRVTVLSAVGPTMPELPAAGVESVVLGQKDILSDPSRVRAAARGVWNIAASQAVRKTLKEYDPSKTVVHAHGWTKALSASVLHEAHRRKFRTVVSLHEYFTACPSGSFFDHQRRTICNLRPMGSRCIVRNCDSRSYAHKVWRLTRAAIQQNVARVPRDVSDFIAISEFSRRIIGPYLPEGANIHRIDNPVDATRGDPIAVDKNKAFIFVGRLSPEKGASLFAEACAAEDVPAVFVGDGVCANDVRTICPKAKVTGWLSRSDVKRELQNARALVFPSLWYETAGLVVSEAASMGIPSIVAGSSAARDMVAHGLSGLLFETGNVKSLQAALRALSDDEVVATYGRNAYRYFWNDPRSMAQHVQLLLKTYREMLKGRPEGLSSTAMSMVDAKPRPRSIQTRGNERKHLSEVLVDDVP